MAATMSGEKALFCPLLDPLLDVQNTCTFDRRRKEGRGREQGAGEEWRWDNTCMFDGEGEGERGST